MEGAQAGRRAALTPNKRRDSPATPVARHEAEPDKLERTGRAKKAGATAARAAPHLTAAKEELPEADERQRPAAAGAPMPPVRWLALNREAPSKILTQGLPHEAPFIDFDVAMPLFDVAHEIIEGFVGDLVEELRVMDDPDKHVFPEVFDALRAAGAEPLHCSVVICMGAGVWAVGMGNGWRGRSRASKLAIAVAIAAVCEFSVLKKAFREYPEFHALCKGARIPVPPPPDASKRQERGEAPGAADGQQPKTPRRHRQRSPGPVPELPRPPGAPPSAPLARGMCGWTKTARRLPPLTWINLEDTSIIKAGLPESAPAVVYDKRSEVFSYAHNILEELVPDIPAEVQSTHDPEWKIYPEVGEILKKAGLAEETSICIGTGRGRWAVGVGGGKKFRETAMKLGLAVALSYDTPELERLKVSYPSFKTFYEDEPSAKRARVHDDQVPPATPRVPARRPASPRPQRFKPAQPRQNSSRGAPEGEPSPGGQKPVAVPPRLAVKEEIPTRLAVKEEIPTKLAGKEELSTRLAVKEELKPGLAAKEELKCTDRCPYFSEDKIKISTGGWRSMAFAAFRKEPIIIGRARGRARSED